MLDADKTECVFIPGKNWRLSLAELVSFLDTRKTDFAVREFSREFFEVNINASDSFVSADDFGGIIKIGVVKRAFPTQLLKNFFIENDKSAKAQIKENIASSSLVAGMLEKVTGKHLFGVSVYCADRSLRGSSNRIHRFVGSSIKSELATEGVKSDFMGFSRDRQFPQLTHVEVLKKGLVEKSAEVLFCVGREQTLMATTIGVHDPFEFQKRDVGKPVERRIFAMPPRLARIMVNLVGCTPGKTLLDPFCGVGTILQEALLSRARVVGVDLNPWCVKGARENLEWLTKEYELKEADFTVLQGDARRLSSRVREVDCIATEPDLGPALRDVPTNAYAEKMVAKLEPLFFGFFEDAFKSLKAEGRLVVVTPYFQTRSGKPVATRFVQKAVEVGFKQVSPFKKESFAYDGEAEQNLAGMVSLFDVAERHKTGREIHVFQK
ncbi:MAG TPA: methyltransferase domain-containing protein [Candidatus Bathyarchaeia archaeon]|nr:methyltransferase domain-containing protein [Candidatus Bathyarchaeia archaeon]